MPVNITYKQQDGNEYTAGPSEVIKDLQTAGYNVAGRSPDGMKVFIKDNPNDEPYAVPIDKLMEHFGHEVTGIEPVSYDDKFSNPMWRLEVGQAKDPDVAKAILTSNIKRMGMPNAQVIGSGEKWYAYNPDDEKYYSLTTGHGLNESDVVGYGQKGVRGLASALGGTTGGAFGTALMPGVGTAAGAALGAGAGAAGTDYLTQMALKAADPDFKKTMESGDTSNILGRAVPDALLGGAFGSLGALASGTGSGLAKSANAIARTGPVSSVLRAAGAAGKYGGKAAEVTGSALKNPAGQFAAELASSTLGGLRGGAELAEMPAQAVRWAGNLGSASEEQAAREAVESLKKSGLLQDATIEAKQKSAPDVLGDLFQKIHKTVGGAEENQSVAQRFGQSAGRGLENMEKVGQTVNAGLTNALSGTGEVLNTAGKASQELGAPISALGKGLQQYENPALSSAYLNAKLKKRKLDLINSNLKKGAVNGNIKLADQSTEYP